MGNMNYCRFQNTLGDLQDCSQHIFDDNLSLDELKAMRRLIIICKEIAEQFADIDLEELQEEIETKEQTGV